MLHLPRLHYSLPLSSTLFFEHPAPTETYTLSLHDALPISVERTRLAHERTLIAWLRTALSMIRSEEHTSELQSLRHLVCRLLLEKKKKKTTERSERCRRW